MTSEHTPRVLSCGCIYDPTPNEDGSVYCVFVQGEHRAIGEAFATLQTPEAIEAFRRLRAAHILEIDSFQEKT